MNWTRSSSRLARGVAAALVLAGTLAAGSHAALAQGKGGARALEGVWAVRVQLRNCATGAALGPSFLSLVTFARGGTIVESGGGPGFAPGQRSTGHGTWTHEGGSTFVQRMITLVLFDTPAGPAGPGFLAGWQRVTHTITVVNPNHATSHGTNEFYDSNGQLYRSGCSTAEAERFE
jgi:hypothetical protein